MQVFNTEPEDGDLLDGVLIENLQAIEMTNIASNILSSMMDAFTSIISNNLNGVLMFLASVAIVLSLPTIFTGFWGMNVGVPITSVSWVFLAILGFIFLTTLGTVFIFLEAGLVLKICKGVKGLAERSITGDQPFTCFLFCIIPYGPYPGLHFLRGNN